MIHFVLVHFSHSLFFSFCFASLRRCLFFFWLQRPRRTDRYVFTGFHSFLLGFTGFGLVLLGFTGFYWVSLIFTGFYWVWLGFTGFYWVLLGFTGFFFSLTEWFQVWLLDATRRAGFFGTSGFDADFDADVEAGGGGGVAALPWSASATPPPPPPPAATGAGSSKRRTSFVSVGVATLAPSASVGAVAAFSLSSCFLSETKKN